MFYLRTLFLFLLLSHTAAAENLTGNWQGTLDGETIAVTLGANGQGSMDDDPITYQIMGNMLMINFDGEVIAYQFSRKGNTLTISGGDLEVPVVLNPVGSKTAKQNSSAATPTVQTSGKDGVAQAMVGKWV